MSDYIPIKIYSVESTNTFARNLPNTGKIENIPILVYTDNQTNGRGQKGNHWESEPGKNLTFSLVIYPTWLSPAHQFELSMLVSIAMVNTLVNYVEDADSVKIKWPNDIYIGDKKIAGILIENTINSSSILKSVIGIGINVNQKKFLSDAPNPISLINITGFEENLSVLLKKFVNNILDIIENYEFDEEPEELKYLYNNMLWRKNGQLYEWHDLKNNLFFKGKILNVDLDGTLNIEDEEGKVSKFLFKEIAPANI